MKENGKYKIARCYVCDNEFVTEFGNEIEYCPSCSSRLRGKLVKKFDIADESAQLLQNADEELFKNRDFVAATEFCTKAIEIDENQPHAHMLLALSEFEVEFDGRGKPSSRKSGREKFCECAYFKKACELADDLRKEYYEDIATEVDGLLGEIVFENADKKDFEYKGTHLISYCGNAKSVKIPQGTTHINSFAFTFASETEEIFIPSSVECIGLQALNNCIKSIKIDENNKYFKTYNDNCLVETRTGKLIFAGNGALIPANGSVKTIGQYAFLFRKDLSIVEIPRGVQTVEKDAFACSSVYQVIIPDSVTKICEAAFSNCDNLFRFDIDVNNTAYSFENGCLIERESKKIIYACVGATVPNGIKSIGRTAFGKRHAHFHVPSSMTGDLSDVFCGTKELETLSVDNDNPRYYCENNCIIERDTGRLVRGCKNSVIPTDGSVKTICKSAFTYSSFKNIEVPEGVQTIDMFAFQGCSELEYVSLPKSLTYINSYAFMFCVKLKSIALPSHLQSLGDQVFDFCEEFQSIFIPASVKEIGAGLCADCKRFKEAEFEDSHNWSMNGVAIMPEELEGIYAVEILTGDEELVKED